MKASSHHAVLISIRPRFADMIFAGNKTVELRRVCPRVSPGDMALVYVSSVKELKGTFEIGKIISASPTELWKKVGKKTASVERSFSITSKGRQRRTH